MRASHLLEEGNVGGGPAECDPAEQDESEEQVSVGDIWGRCCYSRGIRTRQLHAIEQHCRGSRGGQISFPAQCMLSEIFMSLGPGAWGDPVSVGIWGSS